jgi:hypothetical protein
VVINKQAYLAHLLAALMILNPAKLVEIFVKLFCKQIFLAEIIFKIVKLKRRKTN